MKSLILYVLISSCSSGGMGPAIPDPINPKAAPIEYVSLWLTNHQYAVGQRPLYEIERLFGYTKGHPKSEVKFAVHLSEIMYIDEVAAIESVKDGPQVLGQCATTEKISIGVTILDEVGFKKFQKQKFGVFSTPENLEAATDLIYLHELGHCLLGLKHIESILIMNSSVNVGSILKYMDNKDRYINEMIDVSETGAFDFTGDTDEITDIR